MLKGEKTAKRRLRLNHDSKAGKTFERRRLATKKDGERMHAGERGGNKNENPWQQENGGMGCDPTKTYPSTSDGSKKGSRFLPLMNPEPAVQIKDGESHV